MNRPELNSRRHVKESFFFVTCQAGMESFVKHEVPREIPAARFAFSRPGVLTFKWPGTGSADIGQPFVGSLHGPWLSVRTCGESLGMITSDSPVAAAQRIGVPVIEKKKRRFGVKQFAEMAANPNGLSDFPASSVLLKQWAASLAESMQTRQVQPWDALHFWIRDGLAPAGHFDRQSCAMGGVPGTQHLPGIANLAERILEHGIQEKVLSAEATVNQNGVPGQRVLDVCLLEPEQWLLGQHRIDWISQRWPGGAMRLVPTSAQPLSRAYYKIREAVAWSGVPIQAGQLAAEIGASPGGSCQWLLEQGLRVIGIDPADIEAPVGDHPKFTHIRRRGREVPRKEIAGVDWLLSDANVSPTYILDTVEDLLRHDQVNPKALLLTLKLPDIQLLNDWPTWHNRVSSWGYPNIRARQLVFNRQEICLIATKRQ